MFRRTKIVCTLGPAVDSEAQIGALVDAGMNVARINCSHADSAARERWVEWIRKAAQDRNTYVAILFDLQGPKFRLGKVVGDAAHFDPGDKVRVGTSRGELPITRPEIVSALTPGRTLLIGDGDVTFRVVPTKQSGVVLECKTGGEVRSRQGVTVAGVSFDSPPLLEKDLQDLDDAARLGVDFVAVSYVRSAADVREAAKRISQADRGMKIVAKIEMRSAVKEIDKIVAVADAVMVARGDMGLQMAIEDVPLVQKKIIGLCRAAGKPVITATQMMESMVVNPRPTRAEATDVANAIFDGTDAIMLSGETAYGKHPILAVQYMDRIAQKTEKSQAYQRSIGVPQGEKAPQRTEAVARAAVEIAASIKVKAIVCFSSSGYTARMIAKHRPKTQVLCATPIVATARQAALIWGVKPVVTPPFGATEEMINGGFRAGVETGDLEQGDTVVVTAGLPVGRTGTTNFVTLLKVGQHG